MSNQKRNITGFLIVLAIIFTFDWISQSAWIFWVTNKSEKNIQRCVKIDDKEERTQCFIDSIRDRNKHAFLGVNGYLITIIGSFATSGFLIMRARSRKRQRERRENGNAKC